MNKFVKPRTETFNERITRLHHDYDDGLKPAHYDNKKIITMEKRAELAEKIKRPKKFDNNDPSTYPSNQKKTMNTWEAMVELAKNPKDRDDRLEAGANRRHQEQLKGLTDKYGDGGVMRIIKDFI